MHVRRELFQNMQQDVQRAALAAFAAVVRLLSLPLEEGVVGSGDDALVSFLQPVLSAHRE